MQNFKKYKLTKTSDLAIDKNDFVSIAVQVDENFEPVHSGIIIRLNNTYHLHHFPGDKPLIESNFNGSEWYIFKIIEEFETKSEVESFYKTCHRICSLTQMIYGYILDDSEYLVETGLHNSPVGLPEIGSCVGFCIATLKNQLLDCEQYFYLSDWDGENIDEELDGRIRRMTERIYPTINWDLYNNHKKRITPLEYLTSSFLHEYPIRKKTINEMSPSVLLSVKHSFVPVGI